MEWLADPQIWIAFLTLSLLELVLGIDNIVFISILAGKLPPEQQSKAAWPRAGSPRGQPAWGARCVSAYARKRACCCHSLSRPRGKRLARCSLRSAR